LKQDPPVSLAAHTDREILHGYLNLVYHKAVSGKKAGKLRGPLAAQRALNPYPEFDISIPLSSL
jgi:hypothetical protein